MALHFLWGRAMYACSLQENIALLTDQVEVLCLLVPVVQLFLLSWELKSQQEGKGELWKAGALA